MNHFALGRGHFLHPHDQPRAWKLKTLTLKKIKKMFPYEHPKRNKPIRQIKKDEADSTVLTHFRNSRLCPGNFQDLKENMQANRETFPAVKHSEIKALQIQK